MKPRIKTHQMPGDKTKWEKQAMLEGKHPNKKGSKNLKGILKMRERAVLKERAKKEIKDSVSCFSCSLANNCPGFDDCPYLR